MKKKTDKTLHNILKATADEGECLANQIYVVCQHFNYEFTTLEKFKKWFAELYIDAAKTKELIEIIPDSWDKNENGENIYEPDRSVLYKGVDHDFMDQEGDYCGNDIFEAIISMGTDYIPDKFNDIRTTAALAGAKYYCYDDSDKYRIFFWMDHWANEDK